MLKSLNKNSWIVSFLTAETKTYVSHQNQSPISSSESSFNFNYSNPRQLWLMGVELICCFIPDENLFVLCCTRPTSLVHFGTIGIFTPSWLSEECSLTQYIVVIFPRHSSDNLVLDRTIELFSESLVGNFWKTRAIQRTNNAVHFEIHFDTYLMRKSGSNSATYE